MNIQDFQDAFVLWFSGILKMKNEKEIFYDELGKDYTIEFPNLSPNEAILRAYYVNGNICWEQEYKNGKACGKYSSYYESGNKHSEIYQGEDGEIQKYLRWCENGDPKLLER